MITTTIDIAGRENGFVTLTRDQLEDLTTRVEGPLLSAGDEGWDGAVLVWNGLTATLPALALQPTSATDVAAAVGFARQHGLLLSIKGGGHNIAGTSIAERGLMLDMSRMREITVDPEARIAHVGPGCLLRDVDRATQQHGLATVLGFFSEVGVAGLTLGGGLGYLTRRFGWTVDNLLEVEIVTADGRIRRASRDENADLFWAVRGAGGQPRRRHPVHLPPTRGRPDRLRRPDRLAVRTSRRDPPRVPDDHRRGAARADRVPDRLPCPTGAVRAPAVARQADLRDGRLLQRRPEPGRRGAGADPSARRSRCGSAPRAALHRGAVLPRRDRAEGRSTTTGRPSTSPS